MKIITYLKAHLCTLNSLSKVYSKGLFFCVLFFTHIYVFSQTNATSITSGVTFQWNDSQTTKTDPATIQAIAVNGNVYFQFGVPNAYELTQVGPNGHASNGIRLNGPKIENTSASATWNSSALAAYQSLNLNHYFENNGNGQNICDDYTAEQTTVAQRQTLSYGSGIAASSSGVIAITERNANNCYHIEFFGIPVNGGTEQSLGETFVNTDGVTSYGHGGTGGVNNFGTVGTINAPSASSDYWLSDRVVETGGTIGIALFYLNDIAPTGSTITKAVLTAASSDHGDGKLFILTLPDHDKDGLSDVDDLDDENDGILDSTESNGIDPSADHDTDGIPNYQDADFCTLNSFGICENLDFDTDGVPNHFDADSDNDGIFDVVESEGLDTNYDGKADGSVGLAPNTIGVPSSAGSGNTPINTEYSNGFDFLDIDADNDGIPDNIEAQPTVGYVSPSGTIDSFNGVNSAYPNGIIPEDTDLDGVPDYIDTDSDNDEIPDVEENGMADVVLNMDADNDGLDNAFETTTILDLIWDVNEAIEDPTDLSVLPDTDGDLSDGGDLDYRDLIDVRIPKATLDFDGVDDYLDTNPYITNWTSGTIMSWVKIEHTSDGNLPNLYSIAGQENMRLYITNGRTPSFYVITQNQVTASSNYPSNNIQVQPDPLLNIKLENHLWYHLAGVFNSADQTVKLYLNGKLVGETSDPNLNSELLTQNYNGTPHIYSQREFTIGRYPTNTSTAGFGHFHGDIDEVRVFDAALTDEQIQQMVYQEIENNGGVLRGTIIPKDIEDLNTSQKVSWSNLKGYYPMTNIVNSTTSDFSSNSNDLKLHNINTIQEQTAPMPYVSSSNGAWGDENTWLHGDVWDITDTDKNKDWSVVEVKHNITAAHEAKSLGLFIDANKTLTMNGDNLVSNSWYLELNGTLDLQADSQLVQGMYSDLVTSANGKILRRQEGASSFYWYNYWSSPVGSTNSTVFTNNNTTSNNTNNTSFQLNMLKEGNGDLVRFTSANHQMNRLSTRWMYTYENGVTYYDWGTVTPSTEINPGIGYIHKGTGAAQQYIFEGKPNNGTITHSVSDAGGSGSVPGVSKTEYLLGNPYASALDIHKFLDDNASVLGGSIQLWQQWSGTSHTTTEYEGGYAQVNKTGSVRAYQFVGGLGANNGSQDGTKMPTQYLPVGQSFIAEIKNTGSVVFKNSQRVFVKEADADGSETNGSVFFRTSASNNEREEHVLQKLRLEFQALDGQATRRELLLGFSTFTTDGYDYGYEAINTDDNHDDLNLMLDGEYMTIQSYAAITNEKVVPLALKTTGNNSYTIQLTQIENLDEDQEVYLKDNLTGTYFDLRQELAYTFTSEAGVFNERFEIVFQQEERLSIEEVTALNNTVIYYNNTTGLLYAKGLQNTASNVSLTNMLGQNVYRKTNVSNQSLENGMSINKLATGIYIVSIKTKENKAIDKKIVIE
ncbi:LamG-like jellyroll fold domain-containing protein [Lacinutrix cladophorae]